MNPEQQQDSVFSRTRTQERHSIPSKRTRGHRNPDSKKRNSAGNTWSTVSTDAGPATRSDPQSADAAHSLRSDGRTLVSCLIPPARLTADMIPIPGTDLWSQALFASLAAAEHNRRLAAWNASPGHSPQPTLGPGNGVSSGGHVAFQATVAPSGPLQPMVHPLAGEFSAPPQTPVNGQDGFARMWTSVPPPLIPSHAGQPPQQWFMRTDASPQLQFGLSSWTMDAAVEHPSPPPTLTPGLPPRTWFAPTLGPGLQAQQLQQQTWTARPSQTPVSSAGPPDSLVSLMGRVTVTVDPDYRADPGPHVESSPEQHDDDTACDGPDDSQEPDHGYDDVEGSEDSGGSDDDSPDYDQDNDWDYDDD